MKLSPSPIAPMPIAPAAASPAPAATTTSRSEPPGGENFAAKRARWRANLRGDAATAVLSTPQAATTSIRPVPPALVEEQRAGGVRHVGRGLAGELQPDIVLGEQDVSRLTERRRLVILEPAELRRGEAGHGDHAGDHRQVGDLGRERGTFRRRTTVVPQDRRAYRPAAAVDEQRRMHLAGEAHGLDVAERDRRRSLHRSHDGFGGRQPVIGFCSDQPDFGWTVVSGADASATTTSSSPTRTAFTAEVPMSRPSKCMTIPFARTVGWAKRRDWARIRWAEVRRCVPFVA